MYVYPGTTPCLTNQSISHNENASDSLVCVSYVVLNRPRPYFLILIELMYQNAYGIYKLVTFFFNLSKN